MLTHIRMHKPPVMTNLDLLANDPRRIARNHTGRRHIPRHNGTRSHNAAIADPDTGQHDAAHTDKAIAPDPRMPVKPARPVMTQHQCLTRDITMRPDMNPNRKGSIKPRAQGQLRRRVNIHPEQTHQRPAPRRHNHASQP